MEHLERTDIAGNTININKQESKMEEQVTKVADDSSITVPVKITIDDIVKVMFKDGDLITLVVKDSEFDTAVTNILSDNADSHISDWVSSNGSDIADAISDYIGTYVNENIDMDEVASNVRDYIDFNDVMSSEIESSLEQYNPGNGCSTAKLAAKAIINTIRYDLISSMREENGAQSIYDFTITDSLNRFIDKRIEARLEQEKELYIKNKREYMKDTDEKLVTITPEQFKRFVNELPFYQISKDFIIDSFTKTFTNPDNQ